MKLEELNPQSSHDNGAATDDVALGEELYDVWKLYEGGDYDIALTNGESILERYPDSASAHSLMGLVYERKAETMIEAGDTHFAREYLKQALEHYETILDLNPDSAGDREKIASLRIKLSGVTRSEIKKTAPASDYKATFKAAFKTIPTPVLAAMGTFLVVLALGIILWGSGGGEEPVRAKSRAEKPARLNVPSSVNTPSVTVSGPASGSSTTPSTALRVYTFPAPSSSSNNTRTAPAPPRPNPVPERSREIPDVEPQKLPGLTLPLEVKPKKPTAIVQEVKPAKIELPKAAIAAKTTPAPALKADNGTAAPKESSDKQAPRVTGSSLLAQAIQSSQQGSYAEAVGLAQQAVVAFQSDVDSGRNVDAANRGIKNAKNLIRVWQSAGSN